MFVSVVLALIVNLTLPVYTSNVSDTGSMEPILDGDSKIMVYENVEVEDISQGDIITFDSTCLHRDGIVHRVVDTGVDENGDKVLYTRGDNVRTINLDQDLECEEPVSDDNLKGKVVFHYVSNL